jgi:hypothetical protein
MPYAKWLLLSTCQMTPHAMCQVARLCHVSKDSPYAVLYVKWFLCAMCQRTLPMPYCMSSGSSVPCVKWFPFAMCQVVPLYV